MEQAIEQKRITYDFHRLMEGAAQPKTAELASAIFENVKHQTGA